MVPGTGAAAGLAPLAGGAAPQMSEVGRSGNAATNAAAWLPDFAPTLGIGLSGGAVPVPILESLLVPLNISSLPPHLASTAIYSPLRGSDGDHWSGGGEASLLTSLPLGLSQDGGVTTMPAKYYCETCGVATTSETNLRDHEKVRALQTPPQCPGNHVDMAIGTPLGR